MAFMPFYRAASAVFLTLLFSLEILLVSCQSPTISPVASSGPPTPTVSPPAVATPPSSATPPAPSPVAVTQPQPQVIDMIEALRDAGQFGAIAGLLDGLQMKNLTPMTTWLLPNDEAFSGSSYPKNVTKFIDYHVIRELLPYSRLATLSIGTRVPTFDGSNTIVVTNNQRFNYSLNNAMIVVPDLYSDSTVAVHGINAVLDEAIFNGDVPVSSPGEAPLGGPSTSPPSPIPPSAAGPSGSSSAPSTTPTESNPIILPNSAPPLRLCIQWATISAFTLQISTLFM